MGGLNWLPQNAAMKALSAVPSMVLGECYRCNRFLII